MASDSTLSLMDQLSKAFLELEARKDASDEKVHWKEIKEHFINLDAVFKKKFAELEEKEKAFEEKEAETRALVSERESAVAAKEQEMLDRVQELKDVAVAAISAVASISDVGINLHETIPEPSDAGENRETKVSSSLNGTNSTEEDFFPNRTVENPEGMANDVKPRAELVQFCQQMDASGLLSFILKNKNNLHTIRAELSIALESAYEPACLVLDLLEKNYPPNETDQSNDERDGALRGESRLVFLEAMAGFLARAYPEGFDHILNPETKQQAKQIADVWMLKLASEEGMEAPNGHSLGAALLQLLATFRIASEFDDDELCKLVLAVAHHRQTPYICQSLGLTEKIPDIVQSLIKSSRQVDAVRFIHAFQLTESFPPVPLLKAYLKELRRNSQGKGPKVEGSSDPQLPQNDVNARELAALRAVIGSVKEFNLEALYSLDPLQKRLEQLENMRINRKRGGEPRNAQKPSKKPKFKGGPHKSRAPGPSAFVPRHSGMSGRFPPTVPHSHDHQIPRQSALTYAVQEFDPRSYNAAAINYGAYTGSGLHNSYPYM